MSEKKTLHTSKRKIFFGLAVRERNALGKSRIRLRWKCLFTVVIILMAFAWTGKSVALYFFFKHVRDYPEVKLTDMFIFPFNIEAYRIRMGDYDIEQSKKAFEQGDYYKAAVYAYTGVVRSPNNLEGRIYLANLNQQYFRRFDLALETLRQGIPTIFARQGNYDKEDFEYMRFFCRLFLQNSEDEELQQVVKQLLEHAPGVTDMNQLLAIAGAQSYYLTGHLDKAVHYLENYQLTKANTGIMLLAQISWERGQKEEAITLLAKILEAFPDQEQPYQRIIRYLREEQRYDEALGYARRYSIRKPFSPIPRVMILYTLHEKGDAAKVEENVRSFIEQFGQDISAMERLGLFAADVGKTDLSFQLYQNVLAKEDVKKSIFALLLLEAYIRGNEYDKAEAFIRELEKETALWLKEESMEDLFYGLSSVVYYTQGDQEQGDFYYSKFNQSDRIKRNKIISIVEHYRKIGKLSQANDILRTAYSRFPRDYYILNELIETNIILGRYDNLTLHLRTLLKTRRPSLSLLQKAYLLLGSDHFLFLQERNLLLTKLEHYFQIETEKNNQVSEPDTPAEI